MSRFKTLSASMLLTLFSGAALAETTCVDWMDQGDGTSWKTCVDDAGVQHCYSINNTPGSTSREVSCSE